ncbi:MAG: metal ABC transporter permease [Thermoproteota archaeon]
MAISMLDPFILRAILGVLFASISAPISVIMLLRGVLYITPEVSHAALGGVALGVLLQMIFPDLDPFILALLFCVSTAIFVSRTGRSGPQALGMMLSVSLAVSVMIYAVVRSHLPIEKRVVVDSYLVSDLLLLSDMDVLNLALTSTLAVIVTILFYREFVYMCFDMETVESLGLRVGLYDSLLFTVSAITSVIVVRTVGVLLSVTLLVIPAVVSRMLTRRIESMLAASFIVASLSGFSGIGLSLVSNIPTSGAIALILITVFILAYLADFTRRRLLNTTEADK